MSLIVDEHRMYVSDAFRVETFARAVEATVRPGDVVVDIGSGTGFLGFLACRAGARHVYALESNGMIEVARELARANGFADRITFIHHHSMEAVLPERADVLVADLLGGMGFEAGLFQTYADAACRFLKPGARVMPSRLRLAATPVEDAQLFDDVQFWRRGFAGLDTCAVMRWASNTGYPRLLDAGSLLSDDDISATPDVLSGDPLLRLSGTMRIARNGMLHGIGGWFDADLAPGIPLTNSPRAAVRLNRRNVFLPLNGAITVTRGDEVTVSIRVRPVDRIVSWETSVATAAGLHRERHSTLDGMLLTREDIQSHVPTSVPRLTLRGRARRSVLELCDGRRSLGAIEEEVFGRHPDLFASRGAAQAFVAEVVARYSEDGV